MYFRSPLLPKRFLLPVILAVCLSHIAPTMVDALEETGNNFKMVELTPETMRVTNKTPERDPFNWPTIQRIRLRHLAEAEQNIFADYTLQAIVWHLITPQAVINKQLVTIGDMVDGALITKISQTSVSLTKNAKSHTMKFDTLNIDFGSQPHSTGNR
jgi:hypothetical protein